MNVRASIVAAAAALVLALPTVLGPVQPASAQEGERPAQPRRPELGRPGEPPKKVVEGEILVKFKPGTRGESVAEAHRQNGGAHKETLADLEWQVVSVPPGQEHAKAVAYKKNPNVLASEVNGHYFASAAATDPRAGQQWQYNNTGQTGGTADADIDAYEAWDLAMGSSTVAIAILDTGIDQSHEDLKSKLAKNVNFARRSTVEDRYGHGTHVAGIAAAATNNKLGVAGTCPNCVLYNVKVLGDNGAGDWSAIANGIVWAANNGANVINMSFGAYAESQTVKDAINYAWGKGVVLTGAALNDGNNWAAYPAAYDNVIAVGATEHTDHKWGVPGGGSNWGGNWVDVAAPGASILSTATDHKSTFWAAGTKYATLSGTSMAAPSVAGVAGLIWSKAELCAAGNNTCVRNRIQSTAQQIPGTGPAWENDWAYGRINACRAVSGTCP